MDAIYAISVFTHLSEEMHHAWIEELKRVLRPNGLLPLTLHGDSVKEKLRPAARKAFDQGRLVVRGNVKVGSRLFAAFHPDQFVKDVMFKGMTILEKREPFATRMNQTMWFVRKP